MAAGASFFLRLHLCVIGPMQPPIVAPSIDGPGGTFQSHATQVELRRQVASLEACERAPAPVLQKDATARDTRMAIGRQKLLEHDGAGALLRAPQNYFAPDATDAAKRNATKFPHLRDTFHTMDKYSANSDLLRRRAECLMKHGGCPCGIFPGCLDAHGGCP